MKKMTKIAYIPHSYCKNSINELLEIACLTSPTSAVHYYQHYSAL